MVLFERGAAREAARGRGRGGAHPLPPLFSQRAQSQPGPPAPAVTAVAAGSSTAGWLLPWRPWRRHAQGATHVGGGGGRASAPLGALRARVGPSRPPPLRRKLKDHKIEKRKKEKSSEAHEPRARSGKSRILMLQEQLGKGERCVSPGPARATALIRATLTCPTTVTALRSVLRERRVNELVLPPTAVVSLTSWMANWKAQVMVGG